MSAIPAKPWSVAVFEQQRSHLTTFVRNSILPLLEDTECRRIVVRAPVKCGKREMVEYIAMRDSVGRPTRAHAFLSAWHRKADEDQRLELCMQNMTVFSITKEKDVTSFLTWLKKQRDERKAVILHLDECDHGSGHKQVLSKVWTVVRDCPDITNILYSATPQEVLYSGEVEDGEFQAMMHEIITDGHHVEYDPPEGYCGPARFLDERLVHEALPFFNKDGLSEQGKEIVAGLRTCMAATPSRNIIVLRLSYSELGGKKADIKKNKAIYQFLTNLASFDELKDFIVVVDKGDDMGIKNQQISAEKIQWSAPNYWRRQTTSHPILLVIDQTSSRSTEWACHDRIFATHDFRNVVQYSTISQAQERVNHYEQRYGGFQRIHVYGHTRTFRLSAGRIGYAAYLKNEWEKKKIDVRTSPVPMYRIRATAAGHALHPKCTEAGLTEAAADYLLQELGCFADISLSARVAGSIKPQHTFSCDWLKVTQETWATTWPAYRDDPANGLRPADGVRDLTHNPFVESARHPSPDGCWQGYHRGWHVLDYERDIVPQPGWGATGGRRIKICYKGGELGVAIVRCTGSRMIDSLSAYNTMYKH
jgi:hypothetical protein